MSVIDLGHIGEQTPPGPPAPLRLPANLRWFLAAAVAVLVLAAVTASSPPRGPALGPLWSLPDYGAAANHLLLGDGLYVLRAVNEKPTLTAYDAGTGAVRWRRAYPAEQIWLGWSTPEVLLLSDPGATTDGKVVNYQSWATLALDTATGRELWRAQGDVISRPRDGRALLTERTADGSGVRTVRSLALTDGRELWSRPAPEARGWPMVLVDDYVPDRLVTLSGDGDVQVFDSADGRPVRRATLPWRQPLHQDATMNAFVRGHTVLLDEYDFGGRRVRAYDTDTLKQLWAAVVSGGVISCEPVLCGADFTGTVGIDPVTGQQLWRREGVLNPYGIGNGQVLADSQGSSPRVLLDARTGRDLVPVRDAQIVFDLGSGRASPYLIAQSADAPGRSLVTEIDAATGRRTVFGSTRTLLTDRCQASGPLLACPTADTLLILTPGALRAG